jgi:hypothetical protein
MERVGMAALVEAIEDFNMLDGVHPIVVREEDPYEDLRNDFLDAVVDFPNDRISELAGIADTYNRLVTEEMVEKRASKKKKKKADKPKEKKARKETNEHIIVRLVSAGATKDEIYAAFKQKYSEDSDEKLQKRINFYSSLAKRVLG